MDFERLPLPCLTKIEDVPGEKWKVPAELEGPFAPNAELRKAKRLFAGQIKGSGEHAESSWAWPRCRVLPWMCFTVGQPGVRGVSPESVRCPGEAQCGAWGHWNCPG